MIHRLPSRCSPPVLGRLYSTLLALVWVCGTGTVIAAENAAAAPPGPMVFAAASLADVLGELGRRWAAAGHAPPRLTFAASSTLARQIEAGAPAEVFASADRRWMDYLDQRGRIDRDSRRELLQNELVLIAPLAQEPTIRLQRDFAIENVFHGHLCTGEPGVVPAGIYAQQALQSLGWWERLQPHIVGSDDVRAALNFVERGECELGIVYASDALSSHKVHVVATFAEDSHEPIRYPFALLPGASSAARDFLNYLASPAAVPVFRQYGFGVLGAGRSQ